MAPAETRGSVPAKKGEASDLGLSKLSLKDNKNTSTSAFTTRVRNGSGWVGFWYAQPDRGLDWSGSKKCARTHPWAGSGWILPSKPPLARYGNHMMTAWSLNRKF